MKTIFSPTPSTTRRSPSAKPHADIREAGAPACCRLIRSEWSKPATCRRSGLSPFCAEHKVFGLGPLRLPADEVAQAAQQGAGQPNADGLRAKNAKPPIRKEEVNLER